MPFEPIEPGQFTPAQEGQPSSRGYLCALTGWVTNGIGANQAAIAMPRVFGQLGGGTALDSQNGFVTPVTAGSIAGLSASSREARATGTCTLEVYKNAVATGIRAIVNAVDTQFPVNLANQRVGVKPGDFLQVFISSSGWAPTTSEIEGVIWLLLDVPAIGTP